MAVILRRALFLLAVCVACALITASAVGLALTIP